MLSAISIFLLFERPFDIDRSGNHNITFAAQRRVFSEIKKLFTKLKHKTISRVGL